MTAVFFDMDGTLIDSRADLAATVNHTRRDFGLAELPQLEILHHVGQGAGHLLVHAIPELAGKGTGRPADEVREAFFSHYGEHMLESVTLYPGVKDTLEALKERGFLLGVNTAKPRFATLAILENFGLTSLFGDAIVAGGDCAEMKPSALPLRQCAALMGHGLSPDDWMVGDNWTDVKCAANAHVQGVFCSYGFGVLADSVPSASIASFPELAELLYSAQLSAVSQTRTDTSPGTSGFSSP